MSDPLGQLKQWRETTGAGGLTPGPWEWWAAHTLREGTPHPRRTHPRTVLKSQDNWSPSPEDAEFIAASRTAMPALLDAVEAVLELHQPVPYAQGPDYCDECEHLAPCPTVTTITTALEAGPR